MTATRICLLVLVWGSLWASSAWGQADSAEILTLRSYLSQVRANHPISRQSNLLAMQGQQQVRMARGQFDPKIKSDFDLKNFKDKEYFNIWKSKLQVPTWINADLDIVFERNQGEYLNPERNVPGEGLLYTGFSMPVGRGLFTDARRTGLQVAKLDQASLSQEALLMINDLYLKAGEAYWEWYAAVLHRDLARNALSLAQERYQIVLQKVAFGDSPAVDTVEYGAQLQVRQMDLEKALLDVVTAQIEMDNYLWDTDTVSIFDKKNYRPANQQLSITGLSSMDAYMNLSFQHPEIKQLNLKRQSLDLSRALAAENVKPALNLSYHYLFSSTNLNESEFVPADNHKVTLGINSSLLLRKERAKLQLTKIKIQDNAFKIQYKQRSIKNKIEAAFNKLATYRDLLARQQENVDRYQILMDAENNRFLNGDSDVFRINYREDKLLESRAKVIDLQKDVQISYLKLLWAAGTLHEF